jgi:hypothetical protein
MRIALGIFILLHSLVHVLYFGQSAGFFALKPGMTWPSGSWLLSRGLGDGVVKNLASVLLLLAAIALAVSGIVTLTNQAWWRPVVIGAALFSSMIYILLWNGKMQNLDGQGLVGIIINIVLLAAVLILRWPQPTT